LSWGRTELWQALVELAAWGVAAGWVWRAGDAVRHLPSVPDLRGPEWDLHPQLPSLTVVVPAKDEAEKLRATLEALLAADYPELRVLVVDDRSTDATGEIADGFVRELGETAATINTPQFQAMHVKELAEGWLGKTFALELATQRCDTDWILYTDADVLFSPSILRRAMLFAEREQADHVVVLPTMQAKSWGEGIVLGFYQIFGVWATRPWRVQDPESLRDVIGVGAFNLVRRVAMDEIGGWAPQRMAVLEDITLGRRMKCEGMRQRVAFAPGLVLVHWAEGARGLMRVTVKNLFSAFNFQPVLLLGMCAWIVVFCLAPLAGLAWGRTLLPSLVVLCCIGATYRVMGAVSGLDARYGLAYPLGAVLFVGAMLRSMVTVLWQRGVVWRGTHYALADLRQHNSPFVWERAARDRMAEQRRAAKLVKRVKKASR
jgi:cellulose synthase/poly-beta-1,6-N-acetylglucosamine synthase-like glycosyltransferase